MKGTAQKPRVKRQTKGKKKGKRKPRPAKSGSSASYEPIPLADKIVNDILNADKQEEMETENRDKKMMLVRIGTQTEFIDMKGVQLLFGPNVLLEDATLKFVCGRRYGMVGRNGVGKSTLLKRMQTGSIKYWPSFFKTAMVEQEIVGDDRTVLEHVISSDREVERLKAMEQALLDALETCEPSDTKALSEKLSSLYDELDQRDSGKAEAKAINILKGLGFSEKRMGMETKLCSGGWRMRVALAGALFSEPNLLLLDEPTNHLDLRATLWLVKFLNNFEKSVIIVSHDRAFLDAVCTDIIHFNGLTKKLEYHAGDYSNWEKRREEQKQFNAHKYERQERERRRHNDTIQNIKKQAARHKKGKKDVKVGGIRSRKTALTYLGHKRTETGSKWKRSYLDVRPVVRPWREEKDFRFGFDAADPLRSHSPMLQLDEVAFTHPGADKPLFSGVTFHLTEQSRMALVGKQRSGKEHAAGDHSRQPKAHTRVSLPPPQPSNCLLHPAPCATT